VKTLARERDRLELARRLEAVRPDSPARWGRMTAPQMICHVADALRMACGARAVGCADRLIYRTAVKWMALYAPLRWPAGIPTSRALDQARGGGTSPSDFTTDVAAAVTLLEFVATRDRHFKWPPHPLFGEMSHAAWLRWGYLHTDHHLRQFGT
jgi:hypothetical protein